MGNGAWGRQCGLGVSPSGATAVMGKSYQCPMPNAPSRRAAIPLHPLLGWSFPPTSMKGEDSLEKVMREENTTDSFPVVTIGDLQRLDEFDYREQCVDRLIEIVLDIENYMGTGRLFIP
ncbi:hypothetical protein [Nostoc sp. CHAB 5715]|uniref:hypothetical protein n=1 Tax=Nostoc sp. CHAB 5715 TaxID=2780400 RepID=UPI001E3811EC|nr:hypothetical protein [Nostoc sp. CHAB 5715]